MKKAFKLDKKNIEDIVDLTSLQEGILFHYLKDVSKNLYFIQLSLEIQGVVKFEYFQEAWNKVIVNNEMLRTVYRWEKLNKPVQIILKEKSVDIRYYDLSKEENILEYEYQKIVLKDFEKSFDLREVPFRLTLCKFNSDKYILLISNHHIIYDGWSNGIILKEFLNYYNELVTGRLLKVNKKTSFKNYIKLNRKPSAEDESFWKDYLKGFELKNVFSFKSYSSFSDNSKNESHKFSISEDKVSKLKQLCKSQKLTISDILYSAWGILLSKYSGENDILFGTTISGRNIKFEGIERMVGLFINTIPIRIRITPDKSLISVLKENAKQTLERGRFENVPFLNILDYSGYKENELIESIFVVENYPLDKENLQQQEELAFKSFSIKETTNYKLTVSALISDEIEINFNYINAYFERELIENIEKHYEKIIDGIIDENESDIISLNILSEEDKHQLLYEFNDTEAEYPNDKTIHQLFEEQVEKTPDNIALIYEGKEMSYIELNTKANQLAHLIKTKGIKSGSIVGIMQDTSFELIIGIIGILKTGGAYLPIDPMIPQSRKQFILDNSQSDLFLSSSSDEFQPDIKEIIYLNSDIIYQGNLKNPQRETDSSCLCYVMYTSGSTGVPKGVVIEHRSVVNFIYSMYNDFKGTFSSIDNCLSLTRFAFDVSVAEYFLPLSFGSKVVLFDYRQVSDIELLAKAVIEHEVTFAYIPPSLLNNVYETLKKQADKVKLNKMLVGVEPITHETLENYFSLNKEFRIINGYGPTEATICATRYLYDFRNIPNRIVPIGRGLSNNKIYLLDTYSNLVPIGVAGEICVSGEGLGRGYLNNPEFTTEKFIPNPFKKQERLYRTGDLARWLPNGNLEFLGRIDHQVKIRGFRIELGEIESTLLKHENIKESVVLAREENNDKYLCAYIVSKKELNHEELRTYMSAQLPDYMIPSYFVELESLPLNVNGKVNRKALPSPEIKAGDDYAAPSTEIEEKLLEIWSKVLNIHKEDISVNANFFSIGGHSLKATILISRIHKEIGVEFPLGEVFLHPTIKTQASQIAKSTKKEFVSIPKAKEQSNYPVSSAQKRLYLLQQFDLTSTAYNMPYILPLGKEADKEKIENVFKQLINRHESFRTSIIVVDQEPVQLISKNVAFELEERSIESTELENTRNKFIKPFDLSQAPLLRVAIVDIKGEDSLLIDMHHIISDGISHTILEKEFQALLSGEELAPLSLQYRDYSQWQNSKEQQELIKDQEQYWLNQFEGEIPVLNLPTNYVRPSMQSHEGATVNFVLSKEETEGMKFFTKENDLTLYMSLLSAFSILLSKLSGQDDIIVGTPIAGRNHADLENIVGVFINTLSIRNEVKAEATIIEFVSSLKQTVLGAYENQNYQFEDLVGKVSIERDTSRNPIFDVMFNLLNQTEYAGDLSGFDGLNYKHTESVSKFDLTLTAIDYGEQLILSFQYCSKLFNSESIERYIGYFKQIVNQITSKSNDKILEIDILSIEERKQLLYEFNDTKADYSKVKTIHQLFEEQMEKTPEKEAVVFEGISISYRELNQKSNQIAYYLRNKGITRNSIVTLIFEPSHEMIICLLGVLKSGASYLPINPELPENRISYLLRDSECSFILTNISSFDKNLFEIDLTHVDDCFFKGERENLKCVNTITDSIYVIYTSGTTGKPKGVVLTHENVLNYITWFNDISKLNQKDNTALITSYSFDLGYTSVFSSLLKGCELHILQKDLYLSSRDFNRYVVENRISYLKTTPSLYSTMVDCEGFDKSVNCLRLVILGGEAVKTELIEKSLSLNENLQIINHYGPTEATIGCITSLINKEKLDAFIKCPVIGKPINNTEAYVLNETMDLLPIGSSGELCISGDGLAVGYLNESILTDDKFISHPFKKGERLYKTGDLARWLPDGNIEFLGRIDHQVKIRGFRIELGEIESVLLKHENIKESVVLAGEENGDKYLCAYIVSKEEFSQEELRAYLSLQLPDYMIPSYFVELESLPLNANGKVNRKALPSPEIKAGDDYVAPSNEIEEKLVKIWSEVLKVPQEEISTTASFFAIGGHSLRATILVSKIHKELSVKLPLKEVFQQQTIKKMAVCISEVSKLSYSSIKLAEKKEYYALSSAQKRLYFIQQMDIQSISYNKPMVITLGLDIKIDSLENAFAGLVSRHESFRTSFITLNNEPVQRVYDQVDFKLDKKETTRENLEKDIKEYIKPFDLSKDILIRACLMNVSNEQNVLIVDMHHIIVDGITSNIVRQDFLKFFNGEKIAPLKLQYKDFSNWQNTLIEKGELKSQESYWKDLFSGDIPMLNLQTDYKRPERFTSKGDNCSFSLDEDETKLLRDLGKETGSTLYMNILAVLNTLFYRFSNQEDIIIGGGVAGRQHSELQGISGMFVNTLAMRNYPNGEKIYLDFLKEVSDNSIAAFENQDIQFEDLVDMLNIDRDISRNPLFDINMVVQNFEEISSDQGVEDLVGTTEHFPKSNNTWSTSKFDMTFFVWETVNKIDILIEYYTDIYKRETIERYIKCFKSIVSSVIKNSKIKLKEIELLSQEEKQQLLHEFNDTQSDYPKDKTIHELFEEQVDKAPDNVALVSDQEQITYRQLDKRSNQIAHYLRYECEVSNNECIGIYMDRGTNVVISMLGILKSGCGYLPLSVSYPEERIKFMINDTSTRIILSEKRYVKEMNKFQWECSSFRTYLCLDSYSVYGEQETQSRLNDRKLWEYVGDESVDEVTGGGWSSSYTGESIPQEEMDEYGDNVLKKLEPLLTSQTRILEIGCASGISMFRLAPKVELYYGTDLSGTILKKNEIRINAEGHSNIIQKRLSADEIDQIEEADFDLIIINSVIQCFDGHNYLKKVIRKAIDLMKSEGLMFLGDIMDQDLKHELKKDLEEFKRTNTNKDYKTKTDWSEELFLSKGFWDDLKYEETSIEKIESSRKIFTLENELTKYRYDVLISIDKNQKEITSNKNRNKFQHDLNILSNYSTERLTEIYSPNNLAYIIYTSGSTGKPKGTLLEHKGIVSENIFWKECFKIHHADRCLQFSSLSFDASVAEIYSCLFNGASLYIPAENIRRDTGLFEEYLVKNQITVATLPPPFAENLNESTFKNFRLVITAGSETNSKLIEKINKNAQYINAYGPTETSICATYWDTSEFSKLGKVVIGSSIPNIEAYIIDSHLQLQGIGIASELCFSGDGLARGYLNNPELTQEKFISHPFKEGERLYKTGDLARWLPDGNIEFLGRIDHQVKIRGFRIELGEIESTLLKHENIKESVVLAIEKENEKYLCAYVVSKEELNHEELRYYMSSQLPDFMVPTYFVELDSLPLNVNGKVNRKVLPSPEVKAGDDYAAPSNEIEEKLVKIWSAVLNINKEDISVSDNFFAIGGHSLKATVLTSKIHKEIGVEFPLRDVFLHSTIKLQANQIAKSTKKDFVSIPKAKEQSNYLLSPAQKRLYVLHQFDLTSIAYNMPGIISLGKEVDKSKIEEIFKQLINRHESFRTSIIVVDSEPVQFVSKDIEFELEELRIESTELESTRNKFIKPFDLSKAPFLRVAFVDIKGEDSLLMIDMHHIISDGTSHAILEKEFRTLLSGEELAPLPLQYKDYSQWQNSNEQQELIKDQEQYWLNKFEREIPVLNLPSDYVRPLMQSHEGARLSFALNKEETAGIKNFTKENDLTLYMTLLSVFSILLSKLSGQDDIVIGTPIAGRNHADLENIVGMFINTLSIRNEVKGEETIREFVSSLKQTVLGAYENQNYQFEDLVDKVSVERDTSRNPIFDVMFNLLNQTENKESINEDIDNSYIKGTSKFDLNLTAIEFENNINFNLEYSTRLFKEETINRIVNYFKDHLNKISKGIDLLIGDIQLITEEEKEEILQFSEGAYNKTGEHQVIQELFRDQVINNPLKTAIKFENIELNYEELNKKSNQLASLLRAKGVKPNDIVGLMLDRSVDLIIGVLGIIKSGGAYLPIDLNYPDDRKAYMLENSGATLVLIEEEIQSFEVRPSQSVEFVNISSEILNQYDTTDIEIVNKETDLLYVIYTSGSTGNPKGVMLEHRNLVNLIYNNKNTNLVFDRVLQFTSISFDVSFQEIFSTLLSGGQLFLISENDRQDINKLFELVEKESIETLFLPTAYAKFIFNREKELSTIPESIKHIITAGEQLVVSAAFGRYLQGNGVYLHNHYGPTESHVVTTITFLPNEHIPELPSIGKPIQNTSIYILDESKKLQPKSIVGEIYIGGMQIGRGYYENPELTKEKFITHPFKEGERLYRTGDLARWLPDGNIEFLGRIDHQIKIRGFRIELGEIESTLLKHENIKESVVLALEENSEKYLCAYIVSEEEYNHEELRAYMSAQLPDYMVPSYFVELDKLPLTSNGKVNRKALPSPQIKAGDDYVAPSTEIEEKLLEIWSDLLSIDKEDISVNANFFSIGGHSLKATVLTSNIHKEIGVEFPLRDVFLHPTIKSQASQIEKSTKKDFVSIPKAKEQSNYPLSSAQKRLYLLQQFDLNSTAYNMPGIIPLGKELDISKIKEVFKQLINRHESFRTSIIVVDSEPVQLISKTVEFEIEEISIESAEVKQARNKFIKPFDLSKAPFLRARLVDIKGEDSLLMIDMHHIISDGTSHVILEKEFLALLSEEELAPLPLQYKDYSEWQNSKEKQELVKDQEQYWLNKFEGEIPVLNLPTDYVRPLMQSHDGATVSFVLSKEDTEGIKSFTKENDLTLYMTLLSVYSILLSKLSGQEDIVVGTPIAGRNHADLENIVGMFLNTLSMRNEVKGEETIREFVSNIKQTVLGAYENQDYQFEDLVNKISIERDAGRNPIFDVMFNLLNQRDYSGDLVEENLNIHKKMKSKFDLNFKAMDFGDQIRLIFEYNTSLFSENSINKIICKLEKIVKTINKGDEKLKIKEIEIIPEKEKQVKLTYFNEKLECKIRNNTVQSRLNGSYNKFKDKIAIETGDKYISYSELEARKRVVSNWIVGKAINKESLVGILVDDRAQVIISILGILDSSCIFVPLDINLPANRIKAMIETVGINYFITCDKGLLKLNEILSEIKRENVFVYGKAVDIINIDFHEDRSLCTDAVYIYFTSGSTGKPKPIAGKNESLVQFIDWEIDRFNVDDSFRVSQLINIGFDVYLRDIFLPLLSGATICIPLDTSIILDGFQLTHWINRKQVSLIHCVPSVFNVFGNEYIEDSLYMGLRYVLMSGEQIIPANLVKWYSVFSNRIQLVNLYGPTETTLARTCYFIQPEDVNKNRLTIGQAITGSRIIILDKDENVCEAGISGELYIRTAYSSLGYYKNSQMTREKFVDNPFKKDDNNLLYRTGDVAIENSNGEIEIIGRIDHQVKIRGFRIELGEIESVLLKHENIKESVVLAIEENNDKYLCAYVVCKEELNHEELRSYISLQLPDYMVPTYFVELEKLPLNPNGKVNRKALPSPEIKAGNDYVSPSNEIEEKLVSIWSEVLNIEKEAISTTANFFSIGGHSLKATVLTSKIHKEIGVEFPLREVFLHPTIKSQASQIAKSTKKKFVSIPKAKEQSNYPGSSAQKRLYLLQQFDLKSTAYNMPNIIPLGKEVDKSKIEEVFKQLISRHESFRTSIIVFDGEPFQIIIKEVEFELEELSIETTEIEQTRNKFIKPFDLSKAPFLRAAIVDIKGEDSLLMIDMHHIISDGTSHTILEKEFQALLSGEELSPLPLQYKDYSQWQNSKEQQELIKDQEQYWLNKFEGEIPVLNLPIDYVRPLMQSHEGATVNFVLSKEDTEGLRFFTKENDLTLYMSLLSVFSILLSKLSGQDDIIVGTPIAGRNHADLENIVGMFVNTLSIRNEVKGEETIRDFVSSLKQTVLGAYENQNYQFEDLVDKVSVARDTSRNPIFDVMINLLNQAEHSGDISGIEKENLIHTKGVSKFDLSLSVVDYGEQLLIRFEYCTQLFKAETIDRFIVYFKQIVGQLGRKSEIKISAIDILSEEEKHRLLYEFNNTEVDYPKDKTIHQLFEEQVEKIPNNVAVIYKGIEFTYQEINNKSNQLSIYLRDSGLVIGDSVSLLVDRSVDMIIAILGIVKAGGVYVPIDISYPVSRIKYIIDNSDSKLVLSQRSNVDSIDLLLPVYFLEEINLEKRDTSNLKIDVKPTDLSYIIYTSGSTGKPKGVQIEHFSVVNLLYFLQDNYPIKEDDTYLLKTSYCFDVSISELFGWFMGGGRLSILEKGQEKDPEKIIETIYESKVTHINFVPTVFNLFSRSLSDKEKGKLNSLKYIMIAGEALKRETLNEFKKLKLDIQIDNLYGPTEATVYSSYSTIQLTETEPILIGKPIPNNSIYIVDRNLNIQPIGVSGELCIGGIGLARAYFKNPELTREKFIPHPFEEGDRLYRTGDLARWLPDGNIEFLGRIDHQVKIRGFRIELGEIESVLLKDENIKESAVLAIEENNDKYLCAYIVSKEELNLEELRAYLSAQLPDYMVPSYFVEMESLPLNSNGKLNRKALLTPEIKAEDDYVAPSTEMEEKLVEIWSKVLNANKEEISVNANFFSIGGHSLKATVLTSKIHKEIGVEFPLEDVFLYPTIKVQAYQLVTKKWLDNSQDNIIISETTEIII